MNAEERSQVRAARDQDRRRKIDAAGTSPRKSRVVRAAEKAERAQQASEIVKTLIPETPKEPSGRCAYCGHPVRDADVCRAHADLEEGAA